jgi:hypothetical protein
LNFTNFSIAISESGGGGAVTKHQECAIAESESADMAIAES